MSILDLLKEIPLSAVLREKIIGLETYNKSLKDENSLLKMKLEDCEQQRQTLKNKIEQKLVESHDVSLDEIKEKILVSLAQKEAYGDNEIAKVLGITEALVVFHLNELSENGYLKTTQPMMAGMPTGRNIEQKGLSYLVDHKLLKN